MASRKKSILSCAQLAVNILHDLMTFDNSVFNKIAHSAKKMEEIDFSLSLELNSQLIASQFVDEHKSDLKKYTNEKNPNINMIGESLGNQFTFWCFYGTEKQTKIYFRDGSFDGGENVIEITINPNIFERDYLWYFEAVSIFLKRIDAFRVIVSESLFTKEFINPNRLLNEMGTGWLVYVANSFCKIDKEIENIEMLNMPLGKLFITTRENFNKNIEPHLKNALYLRDFFIKNSFNLRYKKR